jgi:hypothetical protein
MTTRKNERGGIRTIYRFSTKKKANAFVLFSGGDNAQESVGHIPR